MRLGRGAGFDRRAGVLLRARRPHRPNHHAARSTARRRCARGQHHSDRRANCGDGAKDLGLMNVVMPQLGETVKEGTVTVWHKKVGDQVKEGERLFEVTTEKVDTEIPAPASGVLAALLVPEGRTVPVGTMLAVIEEPGKAVGVQPSAPRAAPESSARGSQVVASGHQLRAPANDQGPERLSPVVRKLIAEHDLNPAEIRGSGAGGRITRDDVLAYLERRKAPAGPSQPGRGVASTGERAPL